MGSPTSPAVFTYPSFGTYTGSLTVVNSLSGSLSIICTTGIVIDHNAENGSCGPKHTTNYYDYNNDGDMISATTTGLCTTGTVSGFGFNGGTHNWTWSCAGSS